MIKSIPIDQKCQVFDPIMIFPEKSINIIDSMKVNTSCVAPAYFYLEGSRGKRFLCDYHYFLEKDIVMHRTPEQWPLICEYIIDNSEKIKQTFGVEKTNFIKDEDFCWCGNQAYTSIRSKGSVSEPQFFCNFHYRKTYFRYLSNKREFLELFDVVDERYKMTISINEEFALLTKI